MRQNRLNNKSFRIKKACSAAKKLLLALLLALVMSLTATAQESSGDEAKTFDPSGGLDSYLIYAASHNPALKAAYHDWQAAVKKAGYAAALSDPMFGFSTFVENVETRVGPQERRFSLKQSFPWPGTLGASKTMAQQAAEAAFQQFQAQKLRLAYGIRLAYYDYYSLAREIDVTQASFELLTFWEAVVRNRYRTALSPHPDLMKVQVELAKLEDRLATARARVAPTAARLRAALDLPDKTVLPLPVEIDFAEASLSADSLFPLVETNNPTLQAMAAASLRAETGRTLAARSTRPEFSLGVDYIQTGPALNPSMAESGKDPWMVSVGVSLPIWFGKNKARREEAEAIWRSSQYSLEDARNQLKAATQQIVFEHDNALRSVRLYRDGLIPKAEQVLEATYTAYQADAADFLSLLDAQRSLIDFQLYLARSEAAVASRQAELEMLTGHEL